MKSFPSHSSIVLLWAVWLIGGGIVPQLAALDQVLSPKDYPAITLGGSADYGRSMASSGDWLAVGAPGMGTDHQSRYTGGRVLLWKRETGTWKLRQVLTWPEQPFWPDPPPWPSGSDQRFGARMAMDGGKLLVGNASYGQPVHAFRLEGDIWMLDGRLQVENEGNNSIYANGALLLSGDLALVGSPYARGDGALNVGCVDVFQRQNSGWVRLSRLTDPETSGMGSSLAIHGGTIYAGVSGGGSSLGRVAVFERDGSTWKRTSYLLPPDGAAAATLRAYGERVQVSGDRLFVSARTSTQGQVFEYDIPGGHALLNQVSFAQAGTFDSQGDTMIQVVQGGLFVMRRQPDQSWAREFPSPWTGGGLGRIYAGLLVGGDILLSGERFLSPAPTTSFFRDTVMVCRRQSGRWNWTGTLAPPSADQIRDADFGKSVATSEPWLIVGAPSKAHDSNRQAGMAFMYRRGADGKLAFHSRLPEPVFSDGYSHDMSCFGSQVAVSGKWAVVTINAGVHSGYRAVPRVVIYAYDAVDSVWRQTLDSIISAEGGFDHALVMQGDLLAVSAPGRSVQLYRFSEDSLQLEASLTAPSSAEYFGGCLALDAGRLLVGAPSSPGGSVYLYDKRAGQWKQTARLLPPAASKTVGNFGATVALSGSRALVGHGDSKTGLVTPFALTASGGIAQASLISGLKEAYPKSSAMSGSVAVVNDGHSLSMYGLRQGRWVSMPAGISPNALGQPDGDRWYISAGGVALSGSQAIAGANGTEVRILDLVRAPAVSFGGQVTSVSTEGGIQTLDAGEYVVGADIRQFGALTVTHQGTAPAKVALQISGGEGEFTLGKSLITLEPNQKAIADIRFQPLSAGSKSVTLTVTPDAPGSLPTTYVLLARVVATASVLHFTQAPVPGLYEFGEAPLLQCAVSGTLPWSFRWFKDGLVIPGETAPVLQTNEGGTYQVEVTNPHGRILSDPVPLGFYRVDTPTVVALKGSRVRCKISVFGPVAVRWAAGDNLLEDGPEFSGTHTPELIVKDARSIGSLFAEMSLPAFSDLGGASAEIPFYVVSPPEIVSDLDHESKWLLGEDGVRYFALQYEGPNFSPAVFHFRGLPAGLKADETGNIYGAPTTPGIHTVQVAATVDGFTTSKSYRLAVTRLGMVPGVYWGWLQPSDDLPEGGAVVLDLQPSGSYSGSIQLGMSRTPVAGALQTSFDEKHPAKPFPVTLQERPQVFWIEALSDNRLGVQVRDRANADDLSVLMSEPALIKPHGAQDLVESAGSYNFGLLGRDFSGFSEVQGLGFGTLKVSASRRVTYAGQLPDGSAVTGSTWLSEARVDPDDAERVYFYQGDVKTRALLRGAARMKSSEPDIYRVLEWQRPPSKGRVYAEGILPREVEFVTSRYSVPKNAALLSGGAQQVEFSALGVYLEPVPFTLTRQHQAIFGAGAANPLQTRLSIYAPTGFFTGQFTLRDEDPANPARVLTRTVQYRGMLLPELGAGVGCFLLPSLPDLTAEPPTTLATSPIVSGSVWVEAVQP